MEMCMQGHYVGWIKVFIENNSIKSRDYSLCSTRSVHSFNKRKTKIYRKARSVIAF